MSDAIPPLAWSHEVVARVLSKIDASGDCWEWTGTMCGGYGKIKVRSFNHRAHRIVWEVLVGSIPPGMQIDHRCYNTKCVNPDHLEVVTSQENTARRRELLASERNPHHGATHCKQGHPYDADNTAYRTDGWRRCRECHKANVKRSRDAQRYSA